MEHIPTTVQDFIELLNKEFFQVQSDVIKTTFDQLQKHYPRLTLAEVYKLAVNVFQISMVTGIGPKFVINDITKHFK